MGDPILFLVHGFNEETAEVDKKEITYRVWDGKDASFS